MTRKTIIIDIDDRDSRDAGLRLVIEEMPATDGVRFAFQVFQLLASAGIDIGADAIDGKDGAELSRLFGTAVFRVIAALPPEQFDEYLRWFMEYTYWQNKADAKAKRKAESTDIHEISTYLRVIIESVKVNLARFFTDLVPLLLSLRKK